MDIPRFPAGPFETEQNLTASRRAELIQELAEAPALMRQAVQGLNDSQLDTRYSPAAWTVRQIVHHVADSHMHSYIRCKWTLTEDRPTIKAYDEGSWSELPDAIGGPIEPSLTLLAGLHERWVQLLRSIDDDQWLRTFHHPESGSDVCLDELICYYPWHGRHHIGQITHLRKRMSW